MVKLYVSYQAIDHYIGVMFEVLLGHTINTDHF
jgi:hypothetical protein